MSRQPATLSSFAIFNSSFSAPSIDPGEDSDDAHQRAQILFYTSKETAVSKDTMLRQVGLAQAIIAFSSNLIGSDNENHEVHSQTNRMILKSPEPEFWMFASLDSARTPKLKDLPPKDKGKGVAHTDVSFEYHEHKLNDASLHTHLLRGYEEFKLLNGPLSMVLAERGRHELERLLEKFFAPWVWQWNIEETSMRLPTQWALAAHPRLSHALPLLRSFNSDLSNLDTCFFLESDYILQQIAAESSMEGSNDWFSYPASYPSALPLLLHRFVKRRPESLHQRHRSKPSAGHSGPRQKYSEDIDTSYRAAQRAASQTWSALNPRKWNIGTYFSIPNTWMPIKEGENKDTEMSIERNAGHEKQSDGKDLEGASSFASETPVANQACDQMFSSADVIASGTLRRTQSSATIRSKSGLRTGELPDGSKTTPPSVSGGASSPPPIVNRASLHFESIDVFLPSKMKGSSEVVMKRKVWYATRDDLLFAAIFTIGSDDVLPETFVEDLDALFRRIRSELDEERDNTSEQTQAARVLASDGQVFSGDVSARDFLAGGWEIMQDADVSEVIARPTNISRPWIAMKRKAATDTEPLRENLYVQLDMMRADATLIDVERELSSAYSRCFVR